MTDAWLAGKRIRLDPQRAIGKGGEADVYDLGDGRALKIFKTDAHADYAGSPNEQAAARARIAEHQHKLAAFPSALPPSVVAPETLATDKSGAVLGYAMRKIDAAEPLLRFSDPRFRAGADAVLSIFRRLDETLRGLHARGVTVGDCNDLNILVRGKHPFFIDADSFQFGPYPCRVFTERFLDPLIADQGRPCAPFRPETDWYAFAALLMQSLLFVGPYGGIYRPRDPARRLQPSQRPSQRVTIFHPEVQYPRPAAPLAALPDELLHAFHLVFHEDRRGPLPLEHTFRRCASCGLEHARASCPVCAPHASASRQTVAVVRGQVTAVTLLEGTIVYATSEQGELQALWHDGAAYRREDGSEVVRSILDPLLRVRLQGRRTLLGNTLYEPGCAPRAIDAYDACEGKLIWEQAGQLLREGKYGPERIGDVLGGQTRFWLGTERGFGFYEAGEVFVAFVFDPARRGLDDGVKLPRAPGRRVDVECVVGREHIWFLESRIAAGRAWNRCLLLDGRGALLASAEAEAGDGTWLGTLSGKCAAQGFLLCPTDAGVVRVEPRGALLVQTREFPDTEPFVDSASQLFLTRRGLCAAGRGRITSLQMP